MEIATKFHGDRDILRGRPPAPQADQPACLHPARNVIERMQ